MKKLSQIVIVMLLLGIFVVPVQAFTSLYIFGDGITTTTNNAIEPYYPQYYYGMRESNGRIWVEVLAQRLGLGANSMNNANWSNSGNNWSYFGQYSFNLITNINSFPQPPDAPTALYVLWVNCADFVNDMATVYPSTSPVAWNNVITNSLAYHWNIITNLYFAKGCRSLVAPSAVDITEIPAYDGLQVSSPNTRNFIRQQIISFNAQYAAMLNQAQAALPGLTIYQPNFFGLLDNVLTNASAYGLTNALNSEGVSVDAMDNLSNASINGPGTNYIFWDETDPTAKLHEIMADVTFQMIAPPQITSISVSGSPGNPTANQLVFSNLPVGLNGFVDGSTNMGVSWAPVANVVSGAPNGAVAFIAPPLPQINYGGSYYLPVDGGGTGTQQQSQGTGSTSSTNSIPGQVGTYRLRFPLAWNWP